MTAHDHPLYRELSATFAELNATVAPDTGGPALLLGRAPRMIYEAAVLLVYPEPARARLVATGFLAMVVATGSCDLADMLDAASGPVVEELVKRPRSNIDLSEYRHWLLLAIECAADFFLDDIATNYRGRRVRLLTGGLAMVVVAHDVEHVILPASAT